MTYTTREFALLVLGYSLTELAFKTYQDIATEAAAMDYHECAVCDGWCEAEQFDIDRGWCKHHIK